MKSNIQLSHVNVDVGNCQTREWAGAPAALTCATLCGPVRTCAVGVLGVLTVPMSRSLILPP